MSVLRKATLLVASNRVLDKYFALQVLLDHGDESLRPSQLGILMSHHFILMPTMINMLNVPPQAAMDDLLLVLAKSSELSNIKLRRGEKKVS